MTLIQVINELQTLGFEVDYRKRPDGGYIITAINGEKFNAAQGNTRARTIVGASLTQSQSEQLTFNVSKYIKGQKKPSDKLDEEILAELKKTQRLWNKARKASGYDIGHITKRKLRYRVKTEGLDSAKEYLKRAQGYARGYAYPENVKYLIDRMQRILNFSLHQNLEVEFRNLINRIEGMINTFKDKWIAPINDILYNMEKETEAEQKDSIAKINTIISA